MRAISQNQEFDQTISLRGAFFSTMDEGGVRRDRRGATTCGLLGSSEATPARNSERGVL